MKLTRRLCSRCKHYSVAEVYLKDAQVTHECRSAVTDPEIKELISKKSV
jgi:hypothetical protein